jgi:hypothetical protein
LKDEKKANHETHFLDFTDLPLIPHDFFLPFIRPMTNSQVSFALFGSLIHLPGASWFIPDYKTGYRRMAALRSPP